MIQELGDFLSESWGSFTEILSDIAYCHTQQMKAGNMI